MSIQRRFQFDGFAGAGVAETQPPGVEKLALEAEDILFAAIDRIADHGALEPGQVDPNLVGSPGFQANFKQTVLLKIFNHPVMGAGRFAVGAGGDLLAEAGVAAQGNFDNAFGGFGPAKHQGQVGFFDGSGFELLLQATQRLRSAGHHNQARRIAVEPVDNAGAVGGISVAQAKRGQIGVAGQQGVDQRAALVAVGRVDNHTRRLVDDHQIVIFINHRQGCGFRLRRIGFGSGQMNGDNIARLHGAAGPNRLSGHQNLALTDQLLKLRAGKLRQRLRQPLVQPGSGLVNLELQRVR